MTAKAGGATAHLPEGERRRHFEARACCGRVTPAHVHRDARESELVLLWLLFCLALSLSLAQVWRVDIRRWL